MLHGSVSRHGSGFNLVEMLVAMAIFALVVAIAFVLFSDSQKSYKHGTSDIEEQEAVRLALDRLISDLRLAGFNCNPDGDPGRVDEQVEGAWDTAITIRADFDHDDPQASKTPESLLAGSKYHIVSTGNDEIVTYVLAKPGAKESLTIEVDPDNPRSKSVKPVTIPDIALTQDHPPYTLYRVVLRNVEGDFPPAPQEPKYFVYEPVADGIYSVTFRYFDAMGQLLNADTPGSRQDQIGGTENNRDIRSRIRRIVLRIRGMSKNPDPGYVDPTDRGPTKHFRKFELDADVRPENLGKVGMVDADVTPPSPPAVVRLAPGHCGGILVTWDPPDPEQAVTGYRVQYWAKGEFVSSAHILNASYPQMLNGKLDFHGHAFVSGLTDGRTYCFQVLARDAVGNASEWVPRSGSLCAQVYGPTRPGKPMNLRATGGQPRTDQDSRIILSWDSLTTNANMVPGDPDTVAGATVMRDGSGYRLYRGPRPGFTPGPDTLLATLPAGFTTFTDTAVVNCTAYYYVLAGINSCQVEGQASDLADGRAETFVKPSTPVTPSANRSARDRISLWWNKVDSNTDGTPIMIDEYRIYRDRSLISKPPKTNSTDSYPLRATVTGGVTQFEDMLDPPDISDLNRGWLFYYAISATDHCGNESAKSTPVPVSCIFIGNLTLHPENGRTVGTIVPLSLYGSSEDIYTRATVRISKVESPEQSAYKEEVFSYPFVLPVWDTRAPGPGKYLLEWEAENVRGCSRTINSVLNVTDEPAPALMIADVSLPTRGRGGLLSWDLINTAGEELSISRLQITWTSLHRTPRLLTVEFPAGRTEASYAGGVSSPAVLDSPEQPLRLSAKANGLCHDRSCSGSMSLLWYSAIGVPGNLNGTVTIRYTYQTPSARAGDISVEISPGPTLDDAPTLFANPDSTPRTPPVLHP